MKRISAIIASLLLGSLCASAQMSVCAGWQKSQLISTSVASDGYRNYRYAWADGLYAGVTSSYLLPIVGLSADWSILYSYATGTESDMLSIFGDPHYSVASTGDVVSDEHYISVPARMRYKVALAPWLGAYACAGAEVMYCLSSKTYSSWPGIDGTHHWNVDHFGGDTNYNGYRRFDIGVLGGIGFEFMNLLRLEFTVDYGLLDRSGSEQDILHRFTLGAGIALLFR